MEKNKPIKIIIFYILSLSSFFMMLLCLIYEFVLNENGGIERYFGVQHWTIGHEADFYKWVSFFIIIVILFLIIMQLCLFLLYRVNQTHYLIIPLILLSLIEFSHHWDVNYSIYDDFFARITDMTTPYLLKFINIIIIYDYPFNSSRVKGVDLAEATTKRSKMEPAK